MKKFSKKIIMMTVLFTFLTILFTTNSYGWIKLNGSELGFNPEDQKIIEEEIISGASNFLQSYSTILVLFYGLEIRQFQGINYQEMNDLVKRAIDYMTNARDAYYRLTQKALNSSFNYEIISKLIALDHRESKLTGMVRSESLVHTIEFLNQGDLRGLYIQAWLDVEQILDKFYMIKETFNRSEIPNLNTLWELHRLISDSLISGRYVAEVFYKITGK